MPAASFIKARAMTLDTSGQWVSDHYCRINTEHIVSFRVLDNADADAMIYEVYFVNRSIATILAFDTEDIRHLVRS